MKTSLWWIRRDLRLTDNQALTAALERSDQVLPVFILDDGLLSSRYAGEKRVAFLYSGLRALRDDLQKRGSQLVVRRGEPLAELAKLVVETGSVEIYCEPDYSPYARQRDARIERELNLQWCGSTAVLPPGSVLKSNGEPYTVYTPFSRVWREALSLPSSMRFSAPENISSPTGIESLTLPEPKKTLLNPQFPAGEAEAVRRLLKFTGKAMERTPPGQPAIRDYSEGRNLLDRPGTSGLSPYLRFGMLSPRQAVWSALRAGEAFSEPTSRQGTETWLNELIWRDFYIHIMDHFPHVRVRNFRLGHIQWENNEWMFAAWKNGQTGYPVVDAAMRQLVDTGWMHNRARMISASFLTKDLLIDWRWGEEWFMQQLIDGDPASNNGGWQWTAGTGTDAAPYFRIFNPISQSRKYDPEGSYIRRWLPELESVPDAFTHQPWEMPAEVQRSCGVVIGKQYPAPIIEHAFARKRALQAYKQK